jgi:2,4-dienoyl-CoA reductase-like NADH-dependent reductase (Old Yellow Enzyme family)
MTDRFDPIQLGARALPDRIVMTPLGLETAR